MSLESSSAAYSSPGFKGRVRAAMVEQAKAVYAEAASVSNRQLRMILARRVMQDPDTALMTFLALASVDPAIAVAVDPLAVPDEAIRASVVASWTSVAGNLVV